MKFLVKYGRKIGIGIAGTVLLIVGVALLVLPGPGLLVIFAGLFVLSLEFDWFKPHVERVKKELDKVKSKTQPGKQNRKN